MSINNKGFSLPEITVALGLVAGISLVTMKMIENQANNEARIKFSGEVVKATAMIKAAMSSPENCRYMMAGKAIGPYAAPANLNSPLYSRLKNHTAGTVSRLELVRPNTKYLGFKTGPITLRYPQTDTTGMKNLAELVITYRMETKSFIFDDRDDFNDNRTIRQVLPLVVSQVGDVISDCGPAVSETNIAAREKFCLSLGAMATWVSGECKLAETKCGFGTVPEYQSTTGTITCVDLKFQLKPQDLFDTTSCPITASRQFTVESVGGKLKVICK